MIYRLVYRLPNGRIRRRRYRGYEGFVAALRMLKGRVGVTDDEIVAGQVRAKRDLGRVS